MTEQEQKTKIETLERRKKGFIQNRAITAAAFLLILYDLIKTALQNKPSWQFYFFMILLLVAFVGIALYGTWNIKKIDKEIARIKNSKDEDTYENS